MSRRRLAALALGLCTPLVGCGDGTPGFCTPLAENADLESLSAALAADDLETARAEAQRLGDLAETAPTEIRADLEALATSVVDIVDLLEEEQASNRTEDRPADVSAAEVERRRDDLNSRFGELDRRSNRVTTWAARECGLELA